MTKMIMAAMAALGSLAIAPVVFAGETAVSTIADSVSADGLQVGAKLHGPDGKRIGSVYRVTAEGNAQVILDGRLVTVPASTLSSADGKLTTSITRRDLGRSK